jgi:hypothetical protein
MSKQPYIPFYTGDWLKDANVQSLDYFEQGVWMKLLCFMHQSEKRGKLSLNGKPMNVRNISKLLGLDIEKTEYCIGELLDSGTMSVDNEGFYVCRRMVKEQELSEVRKEAGKLGAKAKQNLSKPSAKSQQNPEYEYEVEYETEVLNKKEIASPLWPECEHLRMSEAEAKTVLAHYQKNNYPTELLSKAAQVLDDWLGSTGKEAVKARKQKTHYRRMWADWVLESAQKLQKVANPQNLKKQTNIEKALELHAKAKAKEENDRIRNNGDACLPSSTLATNGDQRTQTTSVFREFPRVSGRTNEKSDSLVSQKPSAQLPAVNPRNSSGIEGSQQAKPAERVQSPVVRNGAEQRAKTKTDSGIKNEISAAMEALRK